MDTKLICGAINCVNNENGLCSANIIKIDGEQAITGDETFCNTFAEKGVKNALENIPNMNILGEFKQIFTNRSIEMTPEIKCEALNCIYNARNNCIANHIQVSGSGEVNKEETRCETFKKRE